MIGVKHPGILTFLEHNTKLFCERVKLIHLSTAIYEIQWAYLFLKIASCFFDYGGFECFHLCYLVAF